MSKIIIPEWLDKKEECAVCHRTTNLVVNTKKGRYSLCSDQCQLNFDLQAGISNVNKLRYKDGYRPQTVGKLDQLSSIELKRLLGFTKLHNKETMGRLKKGDSLGRVLGVSASKGKKKSKARKVA